MSTPASPTAGVAESADDQLAKMLAAYYDVELEAAPVAATPTGDDDDDDESGGGGGRRRASSSADFSLGGLQRFAKSALKTGLEEIGLGGLAAAAAAPSKPAFRADTVDLNSAQFDLSEYMQHKLRHTALRC